MLRMFGLGEGENTELGWGQQDETGGTVDVRVSPYLFYRRDLDDWFFRLEAGTDIDALSRSAVLFPR